jgi:starvation-inducible DNA-binding protein
MSAKTKNGNRAELQMHQSANAVQKFGHVRRHVTIGLDEKTRQESVDHLNQVLVDTIAERIQALGGVTYAMAADVAENTQIRRPPKDREEVPVQISRLLEVHEIILEESRKYARQASNAGDEGTNDLPISGPDE